jgi:amidase
MLRVTDAPPAVHRLYDAAARRFTAAGAVIIEVEAPSDGGKLGDMETTVMLTELKSDLNAYLAKTPPAVKTRTLADIIAFNRQHAAEELAIFEQDLFERAQQTGDLKDPAYLEALKNSRVAAGRDGQDRMLASQQLQVLITPTTGPATLIETINGDVGGWNSPGNLRRLPVIRTLLYPWAW